MGNRKTMRLGLAAVFALAALGAGAAASDAEGATCSGTLAPGNGEDLEVTGTCKVPPSATAYRYGKVNIHSGGKLIFQDGTTTFWASSILVESGSSLLAGVDENGVVKPIGTTPGAVLIIYLYGPAQTAGTDTDKGDGGKGITCKTPTSTDFPQCGIPKVVWESDGTNKCNLDATAKCKLPGDVVDYFYQYHPLTYDDGDPNGYFGYKVLAVSYNGTLKLIGKKGVKPGTLASSDSGYSWRRLTTSLKPTDKQLTVDKPVDWASGDRIVVTTTDYLPAHSEQLQITGKSNCNADQLCTTFDFVTVNENTDQPNTTGVVYHHNGTTYDLGGVPARLNLTIKTPWEDVDGKPAAETRAAVALLSR
ncbi:MAG: hypothetical protein ACRDH5_01500, partial [bacterium]